MFELCVNVNVIEVREYLSNFDVKKEFDAFTIEYTLDDAIESGTIESEFIENIVNKSITGGSIVIEEFGYELHFRNGVLVDYNASDGLNKWAKNFENTWVIEDHREYARKYYKSKSLVNKVINIQAAALARIPRGMKNEYISLHTNSDGLVNLKMLMVVHYEDNITLEEFKFLNMGRYELLGEFRDDVDYKRTTYRLNNTLYTFNENGQLVNTYVSP